MVAESGLKMSSIKPHVCVHCKASEQVERPFVFGQGWDHDSKRVCCHPNRFILSIVMQLICVQMFVILSSNLLSIIEDTLKVQCLSKCKMHCFLWRKYLDENEKGWACAEKHTYIIWIQEGFKGGFL